MFSDQIEIKKRHFTDKYVMVDSSRPELARFKNVVGQVKTVNMSGRALVEFFDYHLNVGWYDIDPQFLRVVDKPAPKVEKPQAKKPAAKAAPKPAAAAKPQAAKAPAAAAKAAKPSVADILAAARAGKAAPPKPAGEAASAAGTKPKAAPAQPEAAAQPAKVDRAKMSVTEMIAAARAGGAAGVVQAKVQSESPPAAPDAPVESPPAPQEAPAEEAAVVKPAPGGEPASAGGKSTEKVDKSNMTIDDIIAWCRQHDAKV